MTKQALSIRGILFLVGALILINNNKKKVLAHDWENQSIYNINREDPVAYFMPFETERYALNGDPEKSKFFKT